MKSAPAVVFLTIIATGSAFAQSSSQNVLDVFTPRGIEPGTPAGSYLLSGLDSVNLYNGNANISVPLMQVTGRGEAAYTIVANDTKKPWQAQLYLPSPSLP